MFLFFQLSMEKVQAMAEQVEIKAKVVQTEVKALVLRHKKALEERECELLWKVSFTVAVLFWSGPCGPIGHHEQLVFFFYLSLRCSWTILLKEYQYCCCSTLIQSLLKVLLPVKDTLIESIYIFRIRKTLPFFILHLYFCDTQNLYLSNLHQKW